MISACAEIGRLSTVHLQMPTALATDARMNVSLFQLGDARFGKSVEKRPDGSAIIRGIRIFRTGTFKDSNGIQHTFSDDHLQQMIANFEMLRRTEALPNVPWRIDHSISAQNIVGWFEKIYTEDRFLLADVHFTEPDAVGKVERGTYRSRSAEVGVYETNDEALYWPVLTGCAFVDLPAVEGLYSKAQPVQSTVLYDDKENNDMKFEIDGKPVSEEEWLKAANYAKALADLNAVPADALVQMTKERDDALTAAKASAAHSKGEPATFMVGGRPTTDVVAVQNTITVLETFRAEAIKTAKADFVKSLVTGNKLAATQLESQQQFVAGLSDEQFESYKKSWEAAPVDRKSVV